MAELLCYGDSNTYGWDPTDRLGRPYEKPWVTVLQELSGLSCQNLGMPGRRIPEDEISLSSLSATLRRETEVKALLILLGTNNRFLPPYDSPESCAEKLERLLCHLLREHRGLRLLLLGLPPMALPGQDTENWVISVNLLYAELARKYLLPFCDLLPLQLPLAYDGLHLTEAGHRKLAEGILESGILNNGNL